MSIPPPYIIIGMHRSGTSLLARVLERGGIFMGVLKDHNYEAFHFLSLNQQSLWSAYKNWLDPAVPDEEHWKLIDAKSLYKEHFKVNTRLQSLKLKISPQTWGWKDPRNTFTLPMWLQMFPRAKVIHIKRNEQDVVSSLMRRNQVKGEVYDERLNDIDFCRDLYQKYLDQASQYSYLSERFIEVQYERLVALEKEEVKRLEEFTSRPLQGHFEYYVKTPQDTTATNRA